MRERKHKKHLRKKDLLFMQRLAFRKVMEAYHKIRSVLGQSKALDYARLCSGTQGAQYDFNDHGFRLIDFVADVDRAVESTLNADELALFKERCSQDIDYSVQSKEFIVLQEKLGAVFTGRGIYPVQNYFKVIKKWRDKVI